MQKLNKKLNYADIGKRIIEIRSGLSQAEFSKIFDISQSDVSRIEKGTYKKPDIELLYKICIAFNRSIEWLLTGKEVKEDLALVFKNEEERKMVEDLLRILRGHNRINAVAIKSNIKAFAFSADIEATDEAEGTTAPLEEKEKKGGMAS